MGYLGFTSYEDDDDNDNHYDDVGDDDTMILIMQMFLQLAGYLGIPVIGWNADNSGLERRVGFSSPSQTYNIICFFLGSNKKRLAHHQNHRVARNENFYIFQSHGSSLRVQLAPSLEHQVAAMIAIMFRFT